MIANNETYKQLVDAELTKAVEATPFRLLIIAMEEGPEGTSGPGGRLYQIKANGERVSEWIDKESAVHAFIRQNAETGEPEAFDGRSIKPGDTVQARVLDSEHITLTMQENGVLVADDDASIRCMPMDLFSNVPIIKEQHLHDAVGLALVKAVQEGRITIA